MIYKDIKLPDSLTNEETIMYFKRAQAGDLEAKEKLKIHNLKLVLHIVTKKFYRLNSELEDLVSIGTIGLIKAVDTFDLNKGAAFSTYASRCIIHEVLMYLNRKKDDNLIISIEESLTTDNDDKKLNYFDILRDDKSTENLVEANETYEEIRDAIKSLTDIERTVIELSYGFHGKPLTHKQIAQVINKTTSYISVIDKRARIKIKKALQENGMIIDGTIGYKTARAKKQPQTNKHRDYFYYASDNQTRQLLDSIYNMALNDRILYFADHILNDNMSINDIAIKYHIHKVTIKRYLTKLLPKINAEKYALIELQLMEKPKTKNFVLK
ncbi:MAG: sigma-70 family RNA polymerase sigma factor [Bacilli bacterium]|nr:sigma-70 family RNA polymerase sigma factor [Bacilli bacterium]